MTSLLQLDNIQDCIGGATSEQITKLFPKCRPRDINLNPLSNQQPLPPASPIQQQDDLHDHDNNSLSLASRHKLSVVSVVMDAPPSADRCKVGCSSVVGGEEEEADEPEEGTENCCQLDSNVGNNTDNSSDLDNSDDMLQDDDEDIVIDHTSVTNQNNQSQPQQQQSQGEQHDNEVIVLTSGNSNGKVGSTYKLRDSRIIEIAGGRELFSQSRSKAARCKAARYEDTNTDKPNKRGSKTQGVWELRSRCSGEPRSKRMSTSSSGTHQQPQPMHMPNTNQREVTETVFSTEVRSVVRHQRGANTASPLRLGEVVVFDDIGGEEDWHGLPQGATLSSAGSSPSPPASSGYHRTATDFFKAVTSASDLDGDSLSPEHGSGSGGGGSNKLVGAGPRVIGNLPIAEYEGSPRRYGPRQLDVSQSHPVLPSAQSLLASPSVYPPRPGFPQRVLPTPSDAAADMSIPVSTTPSPVTTSSTAFDYLYEFSETRKVLEEFFKCPPASGDNGSASGAAASDFQFQELEYELRRHAASGAGSAYVGQRLAKGAAEQQTDQIGGSPRGKMQSTTQQTTELDALQEQDPDGEGHFLDLSADTTGSTEDLGDTEVGGLQVGHSRNFTLSPETTDCDSNCGDLDSEVSLLLLESESGISAPLGLGGPSESGLLAPIPDSSSSLRLYSSMPVLEDGLSSGHASDTDNNHPTVAKLMKRQITEIEREISARSNKEQKQQQQQQQQQSSSVVVTVDFAQQQGNKDSKSRDNSYDTTDPELEALDPLNASGAQMTPPPPAPQPHRSMSLDPAPSDSVEAAIKDIRLALQRTKTLPLRSPPGGAEPLELTDSPIWVPRRRAGATGAVSATTNGEADSQQRKSHNLEDGDEPDTDLETDRLLGQQRTDDQGFFDEKVGWRKPKSRTVMPPGAGSNGGAKTSTPLPTSSKQVAVAPPPASSPPAVQSEPLPPGGSGGGTSSSSSSTSSGSEDANGAAEKTLSPQKVETATMAAQASGKTKKEKGEGGSSSNSTSSSKKKGRNKEVTSIIRWDGKSVTDVLGVKWTSPVSGNVMKWSFGTVMIHEPSVLIEGVLFRARYLGSTQLVCEGQPTKTTRMTQAEEAVSRIKAPEGETQPSTEVDLFISTEKIMVLNTDLKEIMMDHALRTISYIADIGDLVVLMARRRFVPHDVEEAPKINRTPKMICHVFESEEAQFIAQSIGQAFQVAYMEFLKANGIEDHSFVKEMDYQEVLNSQEIFGDELQMFAKKEMQKEVVVPKAKGEILGVVIVESGWGSMLPTVVIANLAPSGAAARCGQLNIGDQIIAINGVSLVGLPLSTCQNYIKNTKTQTVVKLTVVPCAPVVEVKIKRPDTKYQLGFSVQNGVICSLLRGGIAERGGVRVGHRIIEINNQSVVAVPHEKIVNLLATSVGEILMKTMPTSMFRLLTGQETPVYI